MGSENFLITVVVPGWSFSLTVGALVSPAPFNFTRFMVYEIRFAEIAGVEQNLVGLFNIINHIASGR